jgi:hypothetical protein
LVSDKLKDFFFNLHLVKPPGSDIEVMNPYVHQNVRKVCSEFFNKFFSDDNNRILILGINPGRFGAGVTGITFTDPIRLEKECGISNSFRKSPEVSSVFIYDMIREFGGPVSFYSHFILSAVCPLGFIRAGKNINYYDNRELTSLMQDFILNTLRTQLNIAGISEKVVCLGEGKNYEYLYNLNKELRLFNEIIPLPHPRWIMQYRYKERGDYIREYVNVLRALIEGWA